jgi:hypothetical protein
LERLDGRRQAYAAAMPANPPEVADLRSDGAALQPVAAATGGSVRFVGDGGALPDIRRVAAGREAQGAAWIGLRQREDHTGDRDRGAAAAAAWLALLLLGGSALLAWRREA